MPYPGQSAANPFSAEEIRQLFRASADDIDHGANPSLTANPLLQLLLSAPALGVLLRVLPVRDPGRLGRVHRLRPARRGADARSGGDRDPARGRPLGWPALVRHRRPGPHARASRSSARRQPSGPAAPSTTSSTWAAASSQRSFTQIGAGFSVVQLARATLATWSPAETATACGFDPAQPITDPDAHTVTIRLRVVDTADRVGEDRRTVAIHSDATLRFPPKRLGASGEGSPALADVDLDGILDDRPRHRRRPRPRPARSHRGRPAGLSCPHRRDPGPPVSRLRERRGPGAPRADPRVGRSRRHRRRRPRRDRCAVDRGQALRLRRSRAAQAGLPRRDRPCPLPPGEPRPLQRLRPRHRERADAGRPRRRGQGSGARDPARRLGRPPLRLARRRLTGRRLPRPPRRPCEARHRPAVREGDAEAGLEGRAGD